MSFDFLEKVAVSLLFASVLALVKAIPGRFILMLSIFSEEISLFLYLFFSLKSGENRRGGEEADSEAPQALLCGKTESDDQLLTIATKLGP